MTSEIVRDLTAADAGAYIALRREMLADSPWAFASSPEDDRGLDPEEFRRTLAGDCQAVAGAFEGDALVASAGIYGDRHIKMAHRARIWGVYVTPAARGRGVGERVMRHAIGIARGWDGVDSVGLSGSVKSAAALRLYERLGFRAWGVEPAVISIEGEVFDEVHMVLML